MKVIICDDEKSWRAHLRASVSQWADKNDVRVEFTEYESPEKLLAGLQALPGADLLFLDIHFGDETMDGMELASYIRRKDIKVPIIFVTVNDHRANDGYLVEASGFLSKPVDKSRLDYFLNKIAKIRQDTGIIITAENQTIKISASDIIYIEIENHSVTYHTAIGDYTMRRSLNEALSQLRKRDFVRIHRSFVVAVPKITGIKTTSPFSVCVRKDSGQAAMPAELPVSRRYIDALKEAYAESVTERWL